MKRIPHARGVVQALRSVRTASQRSLKGLNRVASQRMARGDYATAEGLATKGREIRQFQSEVEALGKRWREVCGTRTDAVKALTTPLWVYYQPILQGLVKAGGECRRADLEAHVEHLIGVSFLPGDRAATARGHERWRVMVRRARKSLVAEGWIEDRNGPVWRITEAGRRAAERPVSKESGTRK